MHTDQEINHEVLVILLKRIIELLDRKEEPIEEVSIDNLDEVKAALQNISSKQTRSLVNVLEKVSDGSEKQKEVTSQILKEIKTSFADRFSSVYVKKPLDRVEILNLDEVPIAESVEVSNLSELAEYFNKLANDIKDSLNVNVEAPTVNVPSPIVNVPAPIVNTSQVSIDISPILDELDRQLNKIRTNSVSRPLAVRLTDGQEWIKELKKQTAQTTQYLSDVSYSKNATGQTINPATEESLSQLAGKFAIQIDDVTTTSVTYVGKASIGSVAASAVWQIMKIDESGTPITTVITYADGDSNFDNVWSNRASLTYS